MRQNLALVVGLQGRFEEAEQIAGQELSPDQAQANVAYLRTMLAQQNAWNQLKDDDKKKKPDELSGLRIGSKEPGQAMLGRAASIDCFQRQARVIRRRCLDLPRPMPPLALIWSCRPGQE